MSLRWKSIPNEWQPDMFRLEEAQRRQHFYSYAGADAEYISENELRLKDIAISLIAALREEPYVDERAALPDDDADG